MVLLKQHALQDQATRRKWFEVVTLNIYCFHVNLIILVNAGEEMCHKL